MPAPVARPISDLRPDGGLWSLGEKCHSPVPGPAPVPSQRPLPISCTSAASVPALSSRLFSLPAVPRLWRTGPSRGRWAAGFGSPQDPGAAFQWDSGKPRANSIDGLEGSRKIMVPSTPLWLPLYICMGSTHYIGKETEARKERNWVPTASSHVSFSHGTHCLPPCRLHLRSLPPQQASPVP